MKSKYEVNMKIEKEHILAYANYLHDFCYKYIKKSKTNGVVIGLSGGIDSSTSLAILVSKKDINITGVFIDIESSKKDKENVELLTKKYSFSYKTINLTDVYRNLVRILNLKNHLAKINLKVRLRTVTLYALAKENNQLVVGNSNYDEITTGFFTKFGDNACDIALLSRLVKKQVRIIAKHLEVPQPIIDQTPTAGLYAGQTDESELHVTYDAIDAYLMGNDNIDPDDFSHISKLVEINSHKNKAPIKPRTLCDLRHSKK